MFKHFSVMPSKHQSTYRDVINCSHPLHDFLHTLFWNFTVGMNVLFMYYNEKWLRNVWNQEHSIPKNSSSQSVSSEQKWYRKTCKIMKADYSCASKSLSRSGTLHSHSRGMLKETFHSKGRDSGSNLTEKQITCILVLQRFLWGEKSTS